MMQKQPLGLAFAVPSPPKQGRPRRRRRKGRGKRQRTRLNPPGKDFAARREWRAIVAPPRQLSPEEKLLRKVFGELTDEPRTFYP